LDKKDIEKYSLCEIFSLYIEKKNVERKKQDFFNSLLSIKKTLFNSF